MAASKHMETAPAVVLSAQATRDRAQSADLAQATASALATVLLGCGGPVLIMGCMSTPALVATLVAATVVGAAAGTLSVIGPVKRYVPFAAAVAAALAAALLLAVPDARASLFALYNALVGRFDDAFGAYVGLVQGAGTVAASPLFGVCLGTLTALAGWAFARLRTTGITLIMLVLTCGFGLRLSTGFGGLGCAMGVAGWLTQCRYVQLRGSMCSAKSLACDMGINIATCLLAFFLASVLYAPTTVVSNAHNAMWNGINSARFGQETLPEGNLAQAAHLNSESDATLKITPNGTFTDDMLLRGFVGGTYTASGWQALDHTAYEGEWSGIMGWLSGEGLTPAMQRAAYDDASAERGTDQVKTATVSVDASNAYRAFAYVPYTLRSISGANVNLALDGTLRSGPLGLRTYQFTMDSVATADVLDDASWLESSQSTYAATESVYAAFAKDHYLDVSDDEANAISRLIFNDATWDAQAASSEFAVISRVRTMLDTMASYTDNPQAVPATVLNGSNAFTSWLLEQAREGNSAYFATVATLAFRTQGIPARYVEGYRADAGSLTGAALTDSALTLDSGDAHAWCEVYLDGLGWTPIEVTPGFYTQAVEPDTVIDVGEAWASGAGDQVLQTGSVAGQTDDEATQDNKPTAAQAIMGVVRGVAVWVGIVVVAVIAAFAQRAVRISQRKQRIGAEDQAVAVPALYNYLVAIMQTARINFDATKPLDATGGLMRAFPQVDPEEYKRAIQIHQAYAFGGRTLKPNEMRTLRRFNERLHAALPECTTEKERLVRYFVKAL